MAKSKRAGRGIAGREAARPRQRITEGLPAESDAPKRGMSHMVTEPARDRATLAMEEPREDGLDEWLAPDADDDADLDQWLHDHGVDGDLDGRNG